MGLTEQAQEFLVYAALGIVPKVLFEESYCEQFKKKNNIDKLKVDYTYYQIFKCSKRAYLDLNRTLEMKNKEKKNDNNLFSEGICKLLTEVIYNSENIYKAKESAFGLYLNEELQKLVNKYLSPTTERETGDKEWQRKFHFGQMQKWVNMTLKYMNIIGLVDKSQQGQLDIPLDSYIMKSLSKEGVAFPKSNGGSGKYIDSSSIKWSRLNREEYDDIVKQYMETYLSSKPIKWEHLAWIKQAETEKGIIID